MAKKTTPASAALLHTYFTELGKRDPLAQSIADALEAEHADIGGDAEPNADDDAGNGEATPDA